MVSGTSKGLRDAYSMDAPPASMLRVDFEYSWRNTGRSAPSSSSPSSSPAVLLPVHRILGSSTEPFLLESPWLKSTHQGSSCLDGQQSFLTEGSCAREGSL